MNDRKLNSTSFPLLFLMVSNVDHITGQPSLTPTVTLSKNGGAFAAAAGAVTEVGNGWYQLAGNATDRNTLGTLLLHATAAACDPFDDRYFIVPWDPFDGNLALTGLSGLAAPGTSGGLATANGSNQVAASSVAGSVGSVAGGVGGNVAGSVNNVVQPVTVGTNSDKTGYSLIQAFPSGFSGLTITNGQVAVAGVVLDGGACLAGSTNAAIVSSSATLTALQSSAYTGRLLFFQAGPGGSGSPQNGRVGQVIAAHSYTTPGTPGGTHQFTFASGAQFNVNPATGDTFVIS